MDNLSLHPELIGTMITSHNGKRYRIIAWLNDNRISTLTVNSYGQMFRLDLPDQDYEIDQNSTLVPPIKYNTG